MADAKFSNMDILKIRYDKIEFTFQSGKIKKKIYYMILYNKVVL